MTNEIIVVGKMTAVQIYNDDKVTDDILKKIETEAKSIVPDISTPQGRSEIKSMAYKIARTKTLMDNLGKDLTEEARIKINAVNNSRKKIRDRLELLQSEVRKPLTDWEDKEKNRVLLLQERITQMQSAGSFNETPSSDKIKLALKNISDLNQHDWQEFADRANSIFNQLTNSLQKMLNERIKYEADQIELAKMRQEQERRIKEDHEKALAAAAAEKARYEAEAKAKVKREEIERAAAEKERLALIEKEKILADLKAAEEAKIEAEKKAEQDRIEAIERERKFLDKANVEKEAAIIQERERIAIEHRQQAEIAAKRQADHNHTAKINREVLEDILDCVGKVLSSDVFTEEHCKMLVTFIIKNKIRHISIKY
jgi:hypothetical protein